MLPCREWCHASAPRVIRDIPRVKSRGGIDVAGVAPGLPFGQVVTGRPEEREEGAMDITVGTKAPAGWRIRNRWAVVVVALQAVVIGLVVALLIALGSSEHVSVGEPGRQGPPTMVEVVPHPVPAPLGS
jgi:hypothetical protein